MSIIAVQSEGSYVELADPAYQGYTSVANELSKSDRNTLGTMIKERITIKATLEIEWRGLNKVQKDAIMSSTSTNTFNVRFYDVDDDCVKYGKFYRGADVSVTPYGKFDGSSFQYYDVSISLVEI